VGILRWFADAGVDITKQLPTYSLEPLAAVAKFKSVVQRYKALVNSGKVSEADRQRVGQLIEEAEMAIRGIESPPGKPGVKVKAMGGVAAAATALWTTAGVLAADDVTVIGVADDVLIPFVVVGAAFLSGIALFSGPKPVMLEYRPAKPKIEVVLLALLMVLEMAARRPQPEPKPTKQVDPIPDPATPTKQRRNRKCRKLPGLSCPIWKPRLTTKHDYWNLAYTYRKDHNMLARTAFNQNIAVLVLDGEDPIISENAMGFHSEQNIYWTMAKRGLRTDCPILGLFSERKPCQAICQKDILPQLCVLNAGVPFDVFFATDYYNSPEGKKSKNNRHEVIKSYAQAGYFKDD
jgi:hypothetical protein